MRIQCFLLLALLMHAAHGLAQTPATPPAKATPVKEMPPTQPASDAQTDHPATGTPAATNAQPPAEKIYEMFDIQRPPTFPGGEKELIKYLSDNLVYPPLAKENKIEGKAVVILVINKDGSISDVKIIRDPGGGCGQEAVRVVEAMPRWQPGEANGQLVRVRYTLPIRFRLPKGE